LAVGDPGVGYQQAAQLIIDYFTERGLEPRAQVVVGSPAEQALAGLGWQQTYVITTVMAQPLAGLLGDHPRNPLVEISTELTDQWWQAFLQYRPGADHRALDDQAARRILAGAPPVGLAAIRSTTGMITAVGRGHVSGEWLGLAALWTDPDHRRNGMATMIITELGHWAARYGARNVYLQVAKQNTGAIAAYSRLGFAPHHDYAYLKPAAG
jgi:ribosomal protein S18 acetylase RimI-like enzyme